MMTSRKFWAATAERAVKTFAQTLAALLVADGTDLLSTLWTDRLSVAGMAAVVSLLTSVASSGSGGSGPSLTNAEVLSKPIT
jgi:Putative lactococcus lactis phage r1t holin